MEIDSFDPYFLQLYKQYMHFVYLIKKLMKRFFLRSIISFLTMYQEIKLSSPQISSSTLGRECLSIRTLQSSRC